MQLAALAQQRLVLLCGITPHPKSLPRPMAQRQIFITLLPLPVQMLHLKGKFPLGVYTIHSTGADLRYVVLLHEHAASVIQDRRENAPSRKILQTATQ